MNNSDVKYVSALYFVGLTDVYIKTVLDNGLPYLSVISVKICYSCKVNRPVTLCLQSKSSRLGLD